MSQRFISTGWRFRCINVHILVLPNYLKTLVVRGWYNLLLADPRPLKQQVIRYLSIYNMKTSDCSYRPDSQVNINVTRVNDALPAKPDILIGCSIKPEGSPPPRVLIET